MLSSLCQMQSCSSELEGVFADRGVPACVGRGARQETLRRSILAVSPGLHSWAEGINFGDLEFDELVVEVLGMTFSAWHPVAPVISAANRGVDCFTPCAAVSKNAAVSNGSFF